MERCYSTIKYPFFIQRPLSPCGVHVLDGDGKLVAKLVYELDSDIGIPVAYDVRYSQLYENWEIPLAPFELTTKYYKCTDSEEKSVPSCRIKDCLCSGDVKLIPYSWVQMRRKLVEIDSHWLQDAKAIDSELLSPDCLILTEVSANQMYDTRKNIWVLNSSSNRSSHPYLHRLLSLSPGCTVHENDFPTQEVDVLGQRWIPGFEDLPLEIFEVLVQYLDGKSLLNLCESSGTSSEVKIHEAIAGLPIRKRKMYWFNYCTKEFNRWTIYKLWSSYDTRLMTGFDVSELEASWVNLFDGYQKYWNILLEADIETTSLTDFERKFKGDLLFQKQCTLYKSETFRTSLCCGGNILFNVIYPCPSTPLNKFNVVVIEDMDQADCKNLTSMCRNSNASLYFCVKILYFPLPSTGNVDSRTTSLPPLDRIAISLCEECICTYSIRSNITRRMDLVEPKDHNYRRMTPIFEVFDNIVMIWSSPEDLVFYMLIIPQDGEGGYELQELYRLNFPQMMTIWETLVEHRSEFIPTITEFNGTCPLLQGKARSMLRSSSQSGYMLQSTEPIYYGLALVSHIYGIESFKPSQAFIGTMVESMEPKYFSNNGRIHLPLLRQPTCSAKGHDTYVFCSDSAIAISWDCVTWLFDKLKFPGLNWSKRGGKGKANHSVTHAQVLHDHGILLVVDQNILLMKVSLTIKPPIIQNNINVSEPELKVTAARIFQLDLLPLCMEITQIELNFDHGKPFLFVVAERKRVAQEDRPYLTCNSGEAYSFVVKRIDFY